MENRGVRNADDRRFQEEGSGDTPLDRRLKRMKRNWITPGHPTAFSSLTNLSRYYKTTIPKSKLESVLRQSRTYTIKRERKKPSLYNPYFVKMKRKLLQADLMSVMDDKPKYNHGHVYILCVIDAWSRKVWLRPLRRKTASAVTEAFRSIELGPLAPDARLLVDRGSEFINATFRSFLRDIHLNMVFPAVGTKANTAERLQRSLQSLLHKYFEEKQTFNWVDSLPEFERTLNGRFHRSILMSPDQAERDENRDRVNENLRVTLYNKAEAWSGPKKLQVGDIVRVKAANQSPFVKGYYDKFSHNIFRIKRINPNLPVPMYEVEYVHGRKQIPSNKRSVFYGAEVQKFDETTRLFLVDRILRSEDRQGELWHLIRWRGTTADQDSWIPAGNLRDL